MRWTTLLTAGLISAIPSLAMAQEMPPPPVPLEEPEAKAEKAADVMREYIAADKAWRAAYRAAKKDGRRTTVARPKSAEYGARILEIVRSAATPADEAVAGLTWIVQKVRYGSVRTDAITQAREHYLDHRAMAGFARGFSYDGTPAAATFLRELMSKTSHSNVRGLACFALAQSLRRQAGMARYLQGKDTPTNRKNYARTYGEDQVKILFSVKPAELEKEAEGHFEQCVAKFADLDGPGGKIGVVAARELNELKNLGIGKLAPEIEGIDTNGEPFKLSEYRGKVVVIDFWGDW